MSERKLPMAGSGNGHTPTQGGGACPIDTAETGWSR